MSKQTQILFISRPDHQSYHNSLIEKTRKYLKLTELPYLVMSNGVDLAFEKVDKGISAVVLCTLNLEGENRIFKKFYKIPGVRTGREIINYRQGLPRSNMPGLAFIDYLKERKVKCGLIFDIHPGVETFLYNELGIGWVFPKNSRDECIIQALKNMLYPPKH